MRWPFVSRREYDALKQRFTEISHQDNASWWQLRDELRLSHTRYDELLTRYHSLRLAGANPVPEIPSVTPLPAAETDELKALVREVAGNNYAKRAMMLKALAADRASGIPDETIAKRIQEGVSSEGVQA